MSLFSTATNFPVGKNPNSVVVGDFNKDGNPDIATSNNGSNNISILLGTGTGSFGTATNFNIGLSPISLALGDFNSDGNLDRLLAYGSVDNAVVSDSLNFPHTTISITASNEPPVISSRRKSDRIYAYSCARVSSAGFAAA